MGILQFYAVAPAIQFSYEYHKQQVNLSMFLSLLSMQKLTEETLKYTAQLTQAWMINVED